MSTCKIVYRGDDPEGPPLELHELTGWRKHYPATIVTLNYNGPKNTDREDAIRKALESAGFEFMGAGTMVETGERDMGFAPDGDRTPALLKTLWKLADLLKSHYSSNRPIEKHGVDLMLAWINNALKEAE